MGMATTTRVTAIFAIVAAVLLTMFYSVSAAAEAPAPAPAAATDCFDVLLTMSDCLSYVQNGSNTTKPDKTCCPELAGVVKTNPVCLCQLFGNNSQTLGIPIDNQRALKLPSVCNVTTPDPALCSVVVAAPTPAPATETDCLESLMNMLNCLPYVVHVENGSTTTKPDQGCCPELAGVVESNPICLCKLFGSTKIDHKRALKLSSVCGVKTPPSCPGSPEADEPGSSSENNGISFEMPTPAGGKHNSKRNVIGIAVGVAGITIICFVIFCYLKREQLSSIVTVCLKIDDLNAEEIMKNYGNLAPKQYIYSDVKKLTNSFTNKVGQGGYGAVYKGKLRDGCLVAVKVLSESKGNGEEFINEVASISRTSHVNIVSLLGFCYEKTKRALIYEFMPNGSLDKFIYNTNSHLEWKTMYQIALGIARGLEYLHRGCSTRILHLDIKPHNILLDEDFCPKISDFGLAKLCKMKESIVSMTGMRGTIGYIAPEIYNRSFGGVSHKSDVYSYGMLVLEMIGGRKNYDYEASHTSEIYFPNWIYKKLELGENVSTYERIIEEEEDTARKMITVSLWCVQTNPSDRPSMGKVIEMLEGTLESLQFPPKPFFDSPTRSP